MTQQISFNEIPNMTATTIPAIGSPVRITRDVEIAEHCHTVRAGSVGHVVALTANARSRGLLFGVAFPPVPAWAGAQYHPLVCVSPDDARQPMAVHADFVAA